MNNKQLKSSFRFYRLLVNALLIVVCVIMVLTVLSTFTYIAPKAINVPKISNLVTSFSSVQLVQERLYNKAGKTYNDKNQVIIRNLRPYRHITDVFYETVEIKTRERSKFNSKYYPQFRTLIVNTDSATINRIKIPIGLFFSTLLIFSICAVWQVRAILISIKTSSPFVLINVKRLHYLATIFVSIPALTFGFKKFLEVYISKQLNIFEFNFDWNTVLITCICFFLATVFFVIAYTIKTGIEMKAEQELTI